MANILDYLDWRGDLTLDRDAFNEVDNLLLAELSFVDFGGIVPKSGGESVPLWRAAEAFFAQFPEGEKIDMGLLVPKPIPEMLRRMAASRRFGDMRLNCFEDQLDTDKAEQFAALTVELGDGSLYLAFRGTDDTLTGWKEDFLMACEPEVPAQKKSLEYLRQVADRYPMEKLRLGGHSKGGNLAVYAGSFCPGTVQERILQVYSNDGPGFHEAMLERPEYCALEPRIVSIVPRCSIVGMLLEHGEHTAVVASDQLGFLQHDGFSWQVKGAAFVREPEVSGEWKVIEQELQEWMQERPPEQRKRFVEGLFRVLGASGAETLSDLRDGKLRDTVTMFRAVQELDKETREGVTSFVSLMFRSNLRLVADEIREETGKKTGQLRENFRQALEETGRKTEETTEQLRENLRQAWEETGRKTGEKTEQLKESIRQVWEEAEKKTDETVRKIGLKKTKRDEDD